MKKIIFQCHKCEHRLIVEVPNDMTTKELLCKLRGLSAYECPNCGEEPYENWILLEVQNK